MEAGVEAWRKLPLLEGKRAIVTAGAGGIGRAIAERLIGQGARVLVCDIDERALADFSSAFQGMPAEKADVAREDDVDRVFARAAEVLGGLDILVNNAGIAGQTGRVEDLDADEWRRCLDVTLTGQFLFARRAVPMLRAAGGGAIVNISSVAGRIGYAYRTPYSSAKYGVIGLTESLAKELGADNIRVNAVLPGIVEGPRIRGVIRDRARATGVTDKEMEQQYLEKVSMRRMVSAEDIAEMVAFLVSPLGRLVSGQSIGVCGNVETL